MKFVRPCGGIAVLVCACLSACGEDSGSTCGNGKNDPLELCLEQGSTLTAGTGPHSAAAGDLDGDQDRDLVVAHYGSDTLSVFLNDGHGVFSAGATLTLGDGPADVTMGDLDNDGDLDVLAVCELDDTLHMLVNDAKGALSALAPVTLGDGPISLALGLIDSDVVADVVVAQRGDSNVRVLTGRVGIGGFQIGGFQNVATTAAPSQVTLSDLDLDKILDVAVTAGGQMEPLRNNGNGVLAAGAVYAFASPAGRVAFADLDADVDPCLVAALPDDDVVAVAANQGDATFATGYATFDSGTVGEADKPTGVAVRDMNRDGKNDIVVLNVGRATAGVALHGGAAGFSVTLLASGANPRAALLEDFNGDGAMDAAIVNDDGLRLLVSAP
jgi:hypothetical protein